MKKTKPVSRPGPDEHLPAEASSLRYIESSALVAAILERDADAFSQVREIGQRATSALTFTEAVRALIRARIEGRISLREERSACAIFRNLRGVVCPLP